MNEEQAERYLRESLRVAERTLKAAYDSLQALRSESKAPEVAQVAKTIGALSDTKLWDELLQVHGLAQDTAARGAVRDIAERIAKMSPAEVNSDCLQALLEDIDLLRQVIASALREKGVMLSPSLVRECLNATSSIGMEVTVGLIAMLASTEAAGARLARVAVVCTAIGIGVGSATKQIWSRLTRTARAHTIEAQLQQHHHELLDAIGDLLIFSGGLMGDRPPTEEKRGMVLNVDLAAKLQASHLEQLATSIVWPQREPYCQELAHAREQLAEISRIVASGGRETVKVATQKVRDLHVNLDLFTRSIDELRPSWRLNP